jgi:hypothetical protein
LFGREERGILRLERNFWDSEGSVSKAEDATLIELTEREMKNALDQMNTNSAPGLDGLLMEFYKCFWE